LLYPPGADRYVSAADTLASFEDCCKKIKSGKTPPDIIGLTSILDKVVALHTDLKNLCEARHEFTENLALAHKAWTVSHLQLVDKFTSLEVLAPFILKRAPVQEALAAGDLHRCVMLEEKTTAEDDNNARTIIRAFEQFIIWKSTLEKVSKYKMSWLDEGDRNYLKDLVARLATFETDVQTARHLLASCIMGYVIVAGLLNTPDEDGALLVVRTSLKLTPGDLHATVRKYLSSTTSAQAPKAADKEEPVSTSTENAPGPLAAPKRAGSSSNKPKKFRKLGETTG
jgi:hypothetical protein